MHGVSGVPHIHGPKPMRRVRFARRRQPAGGPKGNRAARSPPGSVLLALGDQHTAQIVEDLFRA